MGVGDLAKVLQRHHATQSRAPSQSDEDVLEDPGVEGTSLAQTSKDSSGLKWRAIWFDIAPVLSLSSGPVAGPLLLDSLVAMRLLLLAASIGGGVGPRLAEAAACLRCIRSGDRGLRASGYLQENGVANAHALMSIVSSMKTPSASEGKRGRVDSQDRAEGTSEDGGADAGDSVGGNDPNYRDGID